MRSTPAKNANSCLPTDTHAPLAPGLAFAGVHDSFWTHAGSVPRMNELLREQFVALHSQPLLEELLASFQEQHPGVEFPPLPPRGDLDLEGVKDSTYFFS